MRGNRRRLTWLIATGSVVTAFVAWAALASAALSEHSKDVTIPALTDKTATASCPSGSEAVSGGFASRLQPQIQRGVDHPIRLTSGRQRRIVDGKNFSVGDTSGKMFSYVYCDKHEPNLAVAKKTTTIASNDNGSASAKCPRGAEAFFRRLAEPQERDRRQCVLRLHLEARR